MAKKITPIIDARSDLIANFADFSSLRNIERSTLMSVLEEMFRTMLRKKYGSDENFNIIVNAEKGDLQVVRLRKVVHDADVEDENEQISFSEALKIDADYEIGDDVAEEVGLAEFSNRQILSAKQLVAQRIKELEKLAIFEYYKKLQNQLISCEVYQTFRNEVIVLHEGVELSLPKAGQIPRDLYKKGDTIRAVVADVTNRNGNVKVILSRTLPVFIERIIEREVPEVADNLIAIRDIVHEPGERAKIVVESYDDKLEPVGACVGVRSSRVKAISDELRNKNIDFIQYSANPELFIQRAIGSSKVMKVIANTENRHATVVVSPENVPFAVGSKGSNVKLASQLTHYEIDIVRSDDYFNNKESDYLESFKNQIDPWVIHVFKTKGLDTVSAILELSEKELEDRTHLEEQTIAHVLRIIRNEPEPFVADTHKKLDSYQNRVDQWVINAFKAKGYKTTDDVLNDTEEELIATTELDPHTIQFVLRVFRNEIQIQDDIDLREFSDEIDQWIIDVFIAQGLDSAVKILALTPEILEQRTNLEEQTIEDVIKVLKTEFDD